MLLFKVDKNLISRESLYKYIHQILPRIINSNLYANDVSLTETIESNLDKQYGKKIKLAKCVQAFTSAIDVIEEKDYYLIDFNTFFKVNGVRLSNIVNFIDYGSLSLKGFNLFNRSLKYIQDNMYPLSFMIL